MRNALAAVLLGVALLNPAAANASMWVFSANLDAEQSTSFNPIGDYFGGGSLSALLDSETRSFSWFVGFAGLTSGTTAAHIHPGIPGEIGLPIIPIDTLNVPAGGGIGVTSGIFSGSTILDALTVEMLTGGELLKIGEQTAVYVNIHTSDNGNGEIRGQLNVSVGPNPADLPAAIPVPAAIWLMISAVAGLIGMRRFT